MSSRACSHRRSAAELLIGLSAELPLIDPRFKAHQLSCEYNLPGGHVTQAGLMACFVAYAAETF